MKVLIKVSGSISAFKICGLVSDLVKQGHEVKVAVTESGLKFVGATTWEALSGNTVFIDDFAPGQRLDHIYLNDWADVVVLAPATAQTLNAISSGVGSSVLTTLFLARKKETPYLIFPAMNPRMWDSEIVQKAVDKLKSFSNIQLFEPSEGSMACGHNGVGRLKESDFILDAILKTEKKDKNLLITFGGTTEDIDGVRQITNFSSGRTGIEIIKELKSSFNITALGSESALKGAVGLEGVDVQSFVSSSDLADKLKKNLKNQDFHMVVHAAAISDFLPLKKEDKKISSDADFNLEFKKAPKILSSIKSWARNKSLKLLSFKLTHNQEADDVLLKIKKQFENSGSDFVIQNELGSVTKTSHEYAIWSKNASEFEYSGKTKKNMAKDILKIGEM
ncbi:MAG: bifunctional phosphopantothenoylcysteine decarboxylase/phosphopantothenate--cysteine ligase CoaBC [Bdellovibrionales bacterium]